MARNYKELVEFRCWYCGRFLSRKTRSTDHKIPLSRGGANTKKNKVDACRKCNGEKGSLTPEEYKAVVAYRKGLVKNLGKMIQFYGEKK